MTRRALFLGLLLLLISLGLDADAWARVGGGEGFSTGSSGSWGSGGGGGGGDGDLLFLVLYLVIRYPALGIPLLIVLGIVAFFRWSTQQNNTRVRFQGHEPARSGSFSVPPPLNEGPIEIPTGGSARFPRSTVPGLDRLRESDPGFSETVLLDYLQLLYRRATHAAVSKEWDALLPFVDIAARNQLVQQHSALNAIDHIVTGSVSLQMVHRHATHTEMKVLVHATRHEIEGGRTQRVYTEERWTLRRSNDARSQEPERTARMGCPSCGAAVQTDKMGRCAHCQTGIVTGMLQWQLYDARQLVHRPLDRPSVSPDQGGQERSYREPLRPSRRLATDLNVFRARHPDFKSRAFIEHVHVVFLSLQAAWSAGRWELSRPHVTDTLFQSLRFLIEGYTAHNLSNRVEDVNIEAIRVVRVEQDAWYDAITVRVYASARDWVEDDKGRIVGGNRRIARQFSERWTFLRTIGAGASSGDGVHCPSCGAALDQVSQAGVCGYCDTRITTGRFDWVLARIDQPEVTRG